MSETNLEENNKQAGLVCHGRKDDHHRPIQMVFAETSSEFVENIECPECGVILER